MSCHLPLGGRASVPFISAVTGTRLEELPPEHWQRWLRVPGGPGIGAAARQGDARRAGSAGDGTPSSAVPGREGENVHWRWQCWSMLDL